MEPSACDRLGRLQFITYPAAAAGGVIGATLLTGWALPVVAPRWLAPGSVALHPWTALSLILGSLALGLAATGTRAARNASAVLAIAVAGAATLPLLHQGARYGFGIDTWLLPGSGRTARLAPYLGQGRMSAASAIGLTSLMGALLIVPHAKTQGSERGFSILATVALLIAVAALFGRVLHLQPLDAVFLDHPLAPHTACALAILSVGTLALRPDLGWVGAATGQGPTGWLSVGLLGLAALFLTFGSDAATRSGATAAAATAASTRLEDVLSFLQDAEIAERGYLLTDRASDLAPYEAARSSLPAVLDDLEAALTGIADRPVDIGHLRGLVADRMAGLAETIALWRSGPRTEASAAAETERGTIALQAIRREVAALQAEIARDAARRIGRMQHSAEIAILGLVALAALACWALTAAGRVRREAVASLAESEARQRDLLLTLSLGTVLAREPDGIIRYWAQGCERLYGWTATEAIGRSAHDLLGTVFPVPLAEIETALVCTGEWQGDLRHRARDGREVIVTAHKILRSGQKGQTGLVLEALTDVTAQRRAEAAWRDSQALLRAVIETTPGLIYAKDRQSRMLLANSAVTAFVGKPWTELEGRTDREFLNDALQAEAVMTNDRQVMAAGRTQEVEERVGEANGRSRVWLSTKTPMRNADGEVIGIVVVSVDITERKQAEERLRLLINELNHRVKNTLATVQAIASRTLQDVDPIARQAFEGRLQALATVHDVLTREGWKEASLHDVIYGTLAPHGGGDAVRFRISGPFLRIRPRAAVSLSMALHELASNATKYGSLSCGDGTVTLGWRIAATEARFQLTWSEQGGPPITEPVRRGFGTRLIERSLAVDMGGSAQVEFRPDGVVCSVDAPLSEVAAGQVLPFPLIAARGETSQ